MALDEATAEKVLEMQLSPCLTFFEFAERLLVRFELMPLTNLRKFFLKKSGAKHLLSVTLARWLR